MSEQQIEGFDFPSIEVGEVVLFMSSPGESSTHMMLVTAVGGDTVDGTVHWNTGGSTQRSGVRYITDPFFQIAQNVAAMLDDDEGGVFVEHPAKLHLKKTLEETELRLQALEDVTEALSAAIDPTGEKVAVAAKKKGGRPKKNAESEAAPTVEVRLSDFIGGAAPVPVNAEAKRQAIAAAR
jgi:hypothetical protein